MAISEKAGMLINKEKEVIGWVMANDEYDAEEGDVLITHHKTADKFGLGDTFKEMKGKNAPSKSANTADGGDKKVRGPRVAVPKEGTYTVLKAETLTKAASQGKEIAQILADNTNFVEFFAKAPAKFTQVGRDGTPKEFAASSFVAYAIKRGMISVDA